VLYQLPEAVARAEGPALWLWRGATLRDGRPWQQPSRGTPRLLHFLWNIMLPSNRVLTSSTSNFQTSCEYVMVALTTWTWRPPSVFSSDRSDRLASPSEKNKKKELPLSSSSLHFNTSATALCCLKHNISLGPYAVFQVINPRNVSFCNVAKPASSATVAAVVCPNWRDITQAVGFHHYICLSLKKEFCISVPWLLFHRRPVSALFCFVVYVITFTVLRQKKISVTSATGL
jgi:hypothetical protein